MTDDKFVPLDLYLETVKKLFDVIQDLNVAMLGLRHALMNVKAQDLPVTADYLRDIDTNIRQDPRIKAGYENYTRLFFIRAKAHSCKNFRAYTC